MRRGNGVDGTAPVRTAVVPTPYELVGIDVIRRLVDRFYELTVCDLATRRYFIDAMRTSNRFAVLKSHLAEIICVVLGRDGSPDVPALRAALRKWHASLGITIADYVRVMSYLWTAAAELNVPTPIVKALLTVAVDVMPDVVSTKDGAA